MKASQFFISTLKEAPADAEVVSHQLMMRAGMIKITGPLEDVAYQSNTQEFWNSCSAICDESDYRLFGAFNDGKGQPSQSSAVSHGSATTRFNGVNVINTARKIG